MEFIGTIYQFIPHLLKGRMVTLRVNGVGELIHEDAGTHIKAKEVKGRVKDVTISYQRNQLILDVIFEDGSLVRGLNPNTMIEVQYYQPEDKVVEKIVEIPVEKEVIVEKEVPIEKIVEVPIEKEVIVEKTIEVPVEKEVIVEKEIPVYIEPSTENFEVFLYDDLVFDFRVKSNDVIRFGLLLQNINPDDIEFKFNDLMGGVKPVEVSYTNQMNKGGSETCFDYYVKLENHEAPSDKYEHCSMNISYKDNMKSYDLAIRT